MSAMSPVHSHTMSYLGVSHSLSILPAMKEPPGPVRGGGGGGGEESVGGVTTIQHLKFKFQT